MKKILNQEFKVDDCLFCITENHKRTEFEGKYKLCMYLEEFDSWAIKATDDSMRALKKYAIENAKYF